LRRAHQRACLRGFKDYDRWYCHGVTAVTPGKWMKHIVEMAAAIGAKRFKRINQSRDQEMLRRASRMEP
jgi:hypothetical protein